MKTLPRALTVLVLLMTLVSGAASAMPFTYCFSGGSLCCDGAFGDDCCQTVKAADGCRGAIAPDRPELTNGCNGTLLLSAPTATSIPDTKFALPSAGTLTETELIVVSTGPALIFGPFTQTTSRPHLSSVVLRI
jgi:hypothetical protein